MLEFYIPQIFQNVRIKYSKLKKLKPYSLLYEINIHFNLDNWLQTLPKLHLNKIKLKNIYFSLFL